jgi:hypothetical protein
MAQCILLPVVYGRVFVQKQPSKRRREVSHATRVAVLTEAGYRCAVPTCRNLLAIDLHHIEPVAEAGDNSAGNLIALCPQCHALLHRGTIEKSSILVWKGILVALSHGFDKGTVDRLLFLSISPDNRPAFFTAEGVLAFVSLIAAGIVTVDHQIGGHDDRGWAPNNISYFLKLTDKGSALVEAWKSGDRKALAAAHSISCAQLGGATLHEA